MNKQDTKLENKKKAKNKSSKESKIQKETSYVSAEIVIGVVIAIMIIAALAIFGVYYVKQNYLVIATSSKGNLLYSREYEAYYKMYYSMFASYNYDTASVQEYALNQASNDALYNMLAIESGTELTDEEIKDINDMLNVESTKENLLNMRIDSNVMKEIYIKEQRIANWEEKLKEAYTDEEIDAYLVETYGDTVDKREYITYDIFYSIKDSSR